YPPSETPAGDAFTYQHFRDDALAVLDQLGIEKAHLVGLSMGAYSSLQVGLHRPERVLSLTLAGVGTGSEHPQRGFQGGRPSIYDYEERLRRLTLPVLVVVGDEDDACIAPSLFLKHNIPASGLAMF